MVILLFGMSGIVGETLNIPFVERHKGRAACPSFFLSLLFVPLGAGLRLLRLVGAECNIHAFVDFLKFGNIGAGIFQFGIIAVPLCFEVSIYPVFLRAFVLSLDNLIP